MYHPPPPPQNPYFGGPTQYSQYPPYPPYPPYGHDRSHSGPQFPLPNGGSGEYSMEPIQSPAAAAGQGQTPPLSKGPYYPPHAQPGHGYIGTRPWMAPEPFPRQEQIHSAAYRNPADFSAPLSGAATPITGASTPNATVPQRKEAIFHMLCHAYAEEKVDVQDPFLSEVGKKQCANLKQTFPYIKDVQYLFCSPMYRSMETATLVFGSRLNEPMVSKGFPWSELRECASSGDPEKCRPVSTPTDTGHTLDEIKKRAEDQPFFIAPELMQAGWETKNKTDDPKDRAKRADKVVLDLSQFAEIALTGGVWKGIRIDRPKGNGPVHIVVISHNHFLNLLTHRSNLPGIDTPDIRFSPVQYRSYHFLPAAADGFEGFSKNTLYETKESKERKHVPGAMSQKAYDELELEQEEARKREEARKKQASYYRSQQSDSCCDCCIIQ